MDIKMPKLGESVHEGTIEQWLVSVGDYVEEYEPLCEVITDKVTAEVPSTVAGTITEIVISEGETVEINTVICKIDSPNENNVENTSNDNEQQEKTENTQVNHQDTQSSVQQNSTSKENSDKPKNNGRFSPVVFKLASENQIDLSQVTGTGFEGRVTKKDVLAYINNPTENQTNNNHAQEQNEPKSTTIPNHSQDQIESTQNTMPVNGVRKAIAQNMVTSATEIPHGWMMIEADATNLVKTRNHFKNSFKKNEGYNLTFFAFFVKAVADALKAYPMLNSSWNGNEIKIHKDINISIAVAHENKLFVPVIKHADEKSIKGIAREINELAQKARNNKLTQEDMQGGTFTVNNTGSFGSVSSMGIINHPQAAILQVESIVKKPVVIDDMIAIRSMVNLCISIDHRILDGLQTGQFMNHIKQRVEQYTVENTNIY
ncbi:2-oxoisovalerate dehydrogenase E2 component (dihydrolipoyl transacylase) [Staphylococcus pasteuri]|uniref:Dihydrolipoamide acetyltransferase component of pyruvate dehydrogenase complex n=2 Tax=Staphylococcus TaxID=1279 RepID=A0ABY1GZV9_9STAP|nr:MULTISPECIES: dihydrolipoamide acetyltransferase family protein [Staphylococcus]ATH62582.1 2-oxoglutarate dehydrogenase [Staphylococcus pasteuri]KKI57441.1 Dihydrolipoamide acyltransferase component of branched-chain alpha-keto acid dehydrogenase complex [Staphylococcus pasteuri]MCF7599193.1 2-oxo acid dehydrogenase subunit E2 [Staphylococcus pasteuri]MDI3232588.1 dihydrolipoamide acetyltransferase family protein [Staphylococcus pasteuri]MDO6573459.1 dihydrolipoamide acetyltransferase famil